MARQGFSFFLPRESSPHLWSSTYSEYQTDYLTTEIFSQTLSRSSTRCSTTSWWTKASLWPWNVQPLDLRHLRWFGFWMEKSWWESFDLSAADQTLIKHSLNGTYEKNWQKYLEPKYLMSRYYFISNLIEIRNNYSFSILNGA